MRHKIFLLVLLLVIIGALSGVAIAQEGDGDIEAVTANDEWEPVVREFDGVEMVLVPPGCFMMGITAEQIETAFEAFQEAYCGGECPELRQFFEVEAPQHEICIGEPFWIDRYEVSNAQFASLDGVAAQESRDTDDNMPREQITWFESYDYCELRGARLPNEAEWEYAARGADSLVFPWGDEFDGTFANFCDVNCGGYPWADEAVDDGYQYTAPIGSYADGVSWVGAYDMSGNVWEWTSTIYGIEPDRDYTLRNDEELLVRYPYDPEDGREDYLTDTTYVRVVRGGSWNDNEIIMQAARRNWGYPDEGFSHTGFRCVRDYAAGE